MATKPLHAVSSGAANPQKHPGTVPVTDACHGDDLIDLTVRVVTVGALDLWLSRFKAHPYPDTHRREVAVQNWLSTQRTHESRIPYRVWCDMEVARLKRIGRAARRSQ